MIVTAEFKESFVSDSEEKFTVLAVRGSTHYCVEISKDNVFTAWSGDTDDLSVLKAGPSSSHKLGSGGLSDYWPEELDEYEFLSDVWKENTESMVLVLVNKLERKKERESKPPAPPAKTKDQMNPLLGKFAVVLESGMFPGVGDKNGGAFGHWSNPTGNAIEDEKDVKWGNDRFHYLKREWNYWKEMKKRGYTTNVVMNESEAIACYGDIDSCLKDLKEKGFKVLVYVSDQKESQKEGFDFVISYDSLMKEYNGEYFDKKGNARYVFLGMECILEKLVTK